MTKIILVIDSDKASTDILSKSLGSQGFEIVTSNEPTFTASEIERLNPHYILIDELIFDELTENTNISQFKGEVLIIGSKVPRIYDEDFLPSVPKTIPSIFKALNLKPKTLLLDDDKDFLEVLSSYLEEHGFDCHSRADGSLGTDLLASTHFDVVITDITMPGKDGFHIIRAVDKIPETKIFVVTGTCCKAPVENTFFKPLNMKGLKEKLFNHAL